MGQPEPGVKAITHGFISDIRSYSFLPQRKNPDNLTDTNCFEKNGIP